MSDTIIIDTGAHLERRREDGTLEPLTIAQIADGAFLREGRIIAPCITWDKQFPGQVTLGRIGIPVIRNCPLDWHPSAVTKSVLAALEAK